MKRCPSRTVWQPLKVGDKWGFIDPNGRMAIAPRFESAFYFIEGVARVETHCRGRSN